jgi:hypothetical protein
MDTLLVVFHVLLCDILTDCLLYNGPIQQIHAFKVEVIEQECSPKLGYTICCWVNIKMAEFAVREAQRH